LRADRARRRARDLYARSLEARGPAWSNAARLVLTGWENCWIAPAIDALQSLVLLCGDEADDSEEGGT
jgi:hypothetical protein